MSKKPPVESKLAADFPLGKDYSIEKLIGTGSYGTVVLARHEPSGKKVAIKKLIDIFHYLDEARFILREISILRELDNHSNVVKLYDVLITQDLKEFNTIYLVFEYVEGELRRLIRSKSYLNESHVQFIMYSLLNGIRYLHSSNVIHRDIKPANILVTQDCCAKLCDFGSARQITGIKTFYAQEKKPKEWLEGTKTLRTALKRQLTSHVATRYYRAPELILMEKDYGRPVDVWAAGVVFGELLMTI